MPTSGPYDQNAQQPPPWHSPASRPRPLLEIANQWAKTRAVAIALISGLASVGVLSKDQSGFSVDALSALDVVIAAVFGLITAITQLYGAFKVAREGAKVVTPTSDPRDDAGRRLVPATAAA